MPSSPAFPSSSLPQRDRITILSALIGVIVLAWAYVIYLRVQMPAMDLADSGRMHQWTSVDFVFMFAMWAIMMVGMMLPSVIPMTLLYAGMARKAERQGTLMAPISTFVSGYVAMWCLFSVGATVVQWGLREASMLSPMMVTKSPVLGGSLLIVTGVYQLTPWKTVCFEHCRSPMRFIAEHWRPGVSGAFRLGLQHGAFCLGSYWVLMGLLFVGGVMNLLWIAGITIFVFLEKVLPISRWNIHVGSIAGIGLIISGVGVLASR